MTLFKQHLITFVCLSILILSGCDDNTNMVGNNLIPDRDIITVYSDTFLIKASTVQYDSLFAKTTYGLLGEYYDPLYGRLKSDYLCQFYCEDGYQFTDTPYENKIDSIYLTLYYTETGDPNTPIQFQVFPVTQPLDKVYYTNVDPAAYCDLSNVWGSQVFTAANGILDDSTQVAVDKYVYYRYLQIPLPVEFGQRIYEETVNNPASFKTQQAFNDFFPGIYVTTGYGSGCLFNVLGTSISIHYKSVLESSTGQDSTAYYREVFITTKEVIQLNRFENSDTEQLLAPNDDYMFIKTPAGIYTRLVLPAQEIKPVIADRIINSMVFNLRFMPNENWPYALGPPSHLLLLPEDSLHSFFYNRKVDNNVTSFISTGSATSTSAQSTTGYSADTRMYYFNNIANLLAYHLSTSPDDDLRLLVVPVTRSTSTDTYGNYYSTEISNFLAPSGLKLRKDMDFMQISIASSIYHNK